MPVAEIRFYDVVAFIHVAAVVLAFGPTFGYAIFQAVTERRFPRGVPTMYAATRTSDLYLVTPLALLVLAAGLYLTIDGPWEFSDPFVGVGLAAIIVLLGLVHGFFGPHEMKAKALAERDIAAAGDGEVSFSDEYWAVSKRLGLVGTLAGLIVLVAIFFMVVKP